MKTQADLRLMAAEIDSGKRNSTGNEFPETIKHLVGGIPTPLKNMSQWEGLSHILWKVIKFMFQTTNQ